MSAKGTAKIVIEAPTAAKVQELANLIQLAVRKVDTEDLLKLLNAVKDRPKLVRTALCFV